MSKPPQVTRIGNVTLTTGPLLVLRADGDAVLDAELALELASALTRFAREMCVAESCRVLADAEADVAAVVGRAVMSRSDAVQAEVYRQALVGIAGCAPHRLSGESDAQWHERVRAAHMLAGA